MGFVVDDDEGVPLVGCGAQSEASGPTMQRATHAEHAPDEFVAVAPHRRAAPDHLDRADPRDEVLPIEGTIMNHALSLTPAAVAALFDLPDRQVRKEIEHGIVPSSGPPRLDFASLVYLRLLSMLGLDIGVDGRRHLQKIVAHAAGQDPVPETIEWLPMLTLKVGPVARHVTARVGAFERRRAKLVASPDILGGEPVFPSSRLAVRYVGALAESGESVESIREDYPYLSAEDIHHAHVYTRAYPKIGRPRGRREASAR